MKFKILLIGIVGDTNYILLEEIGIGTICAVLREKGYQVRIMGGPLDEIDFKKIEEFKPDIIGGPVYHESKDSFYKFCSRIKPLLPDVLICAGGYTATYHDREMLEEAGFINFVVRGEGEYTFLELVEHLEKGKNLEDINGLTYRNKGNIVANQNRELMADINVLPFPSRDFLLERGLKMAVISTSRGCMANCSFCVSRSFWKGWRGRSSEKVLREISFLSRELGVRYINFIDSSIEDPDADCQRIAEIARGIVQQGIDISYFADVRAEFYKKADRQLIELLIKSGLRVVLIGIEAANTADLRLYGKRATVEDNHRCIDFFRKFQIRVKLGFMNFNPYSTFQRLSENIDFLESHCYAWDYFLIASRYSLEKGGRLYAKIKASGLLKEGLFNSIHNYRFVHPAIEQLCNHIVNALPIINRESKGAISRISNYGQLYLDLLRDIKIRANSNDNPRLFQLIEEHESEITAVLEEVNHTNARSFRELLQLAQNAWNPDEADRIMKRTTSPVYLRGIVTDLDTKRARFYKKISSLPEEYHFILHFLNSFFI